MKINWKVRFKHKHFLLSLFSLIWLVAQQVASLLGFDITIYNEPLTGIFHAVLGILVLLGIVIDPTTDSMSDSKEAQEYKTPKKNEERV